MNFHDFVAPFFDVALSLKTGLRVTHFIGLVLGLGAATLLDIIIIRFFVSRKISADQCQVVEFMTKIVTVGLALLWISGIWFILYYSVFDPAKLYNEKVWAKMAIVGILTLNGVFIHHSVLPLIRQKIGQSLLDGLSGRQRSILLAAGVVSGTSWYVPLLLGSVPQLNFVVPAWVILAAYGVLLGTGIVLVQTVARAILPATDAAPGEERPNPVAQRSIRLTAQPPWNNTALALQGVNMQVFAASNGQTARAGCADNLFTWDQPTK